MIGATEVVRSQPDEHVAFRNTSTQVLIPVIMSKPPYDPVKDFAGVYIMCFVAHLHRGARVRAGAHAHGVHRLRQGQPNQAVLWHGRHRHHDQFVRRTVQASDRRA